MLWPLTINWNIIGLAAKKDFAWVSCTWTETSAAKQIVIIAAMLLDSICRQLGKGLMVYSHQFIHINVYTLLVLLNGALQISRLANRQNYSTCMSARQEYNPNHLIQAYLAAQLRLYYSSKFCKWKNYMLVFQSAISELSFDSQTSHNSYILNVIRPMK